MGADAAGGGAQVPRVKLVVGKRYAQLPEERFSIEVFRAIVELRLVRVEAERLVGLQDFRPQMQALHCYRCLPSLRFFFATCAGDAVESARPWSGLRHVHCGGNAVRAMDGTLGLMPFVRTLDLSDNGLTEVTDDVRHLHSLETLNLGYNRIASLRPFSTLAVAEALRRVTVLTLCNNRLISLHGIECLMGLEELDLTQNEISDFDELRRIGHMVRLHRLWLGGNPVSFLGHYRGRTLAYFRQWSKLELDGEPCTSFEETLMVEHFIAISGCCHPSDDPGWDRMRTGPPAAVSAPASPATSSRRRRTRVKSAEITEAAAEPGAADGGDGAGALDVSELLEGIVRGNEAIQQGAAIAVEKTRGGGGGKRRRKKKQSANKSGASGILEEQDTLHAQVQGIFEASGEKALAVYQAWVDGMAPELDTSVDLSVDGPDVMPLNTTSTPKKGGDEAPEPPASPVSVGSGPAIVGASTPRAGSDKSGTDDGLKAGVAEAAAEALLDWTGRGEGGASSPGGEADPGGDLPGEAEAWEPAVLEVTVVGDEEGEEAFGDPRCASSPAPQVSPTRSMRSIASIKAPEAESTEEYLCQIFDRKKTLHPRIIQVQGKTALTVIDVVTGHTVDIFDLGSLVEARAGSAIGSGLLEDAVEVGHSLNLEFSYGGSERRSLEFIVEAPEDGESLMRTLQPIAEQNRKATVGKVEMHLKCLVCDRLFDADAELADGGVKCPGCGSASVVEFFVSAGAGEAGDGGGAQRGRDPGPAPAAEPAPVVGLAPERCPSPPEPFDCRELDHNRKLVMDLQFFQENEQAVGAVDAHVVLCRCGPKDPEVMVPRPGFVVVSTCCLYAFLLPPDDPEALALGARVPFAKILALGVGISSQYLHVMTSSNEIDLFVGDAGMLNSFLGVLAETPAMAKVPITPVDLRLLAALARADGTAESGLDQAAAAGSSHPPYNAETVMSPEQLSARLAAITVPPIEACVVGRRRGHPFGAILLTEDALHVVELEYRSRTGALSFEMVARLTESVDISDVSSASRIAGSSTGVTLSLWGEDSGSDGMSLDFLTDGGLWTLATRLGVLWQRSFSVPLPWE